jgi:site-specific recombinase XerD
MKEKDSGGPGKKFRTKSRAETLTRGGPGSAAGRAQEAIKAHPNDPLRQMTRFLSDLDLQAFKGRQRQVSYRTETSFGRTLKNATQELRKVRMPIQRIDQIGRSHALALAVYWANELGHSASTIQNKLTNIRKFCELIGKTGAVPKKDELYQEMEAKGVDRSALKRHQVTHGSKTWKAAGVDASAIIAFMEDENPQEALLFELELCFGLRVNEALSYRPMESERVDGIMVNLGTKGGKGRFVPFLKDPVKAARQRDVQSRARAWAQKHPKGEMGYVRMSIEEARTKYYHELRKYRINKKDMGVSSHGLRHEFAADYFEDLTGHRPPAEGLESSTWFKENRDLVEHAYKKVSEALGHWRKDISTAYLSSVSFMSKTQLKRVEKLLEVFQITPGVAEGLLDAGVERAWLTGRAAMGVEMAHNERIQLTVTLEQGVEFAALVEIQTRLEKLLPGRVQVSPLLIGVQPDDGVEVFLD